jgi:RNA polymerase sigma-70 factor, ECF subfamily
MNNLKHDPNDTPSDAELVLRSQRGDVDACTLLVRRYEKLVVAAAHHVTRDRHAADDAAQDAFFAAFNSLATLRDRDRFGPWLLAIARNQASRFVRSRVRTEACVPDIALIESPSESPSEARLSETSERLLELVERLPEHERIVVGLRYFRGHTAEEVARITGRPIGTVTKQLSRAHARLEQWLGQEIHK